MISDNEKARALTLQRRQQEKRQDAEDLKIYS